MSSMPPLKMGGPPPGTTPQGLSSLLPKGGPAPGGMPPEGGPDEATPSGGGGGFGESFYKTVDTILANSEPLARGVHADETSIEVGNILNTIVSGGMTIEEGLVAIDEKITEIQSK